MPPAVRLFLTLLLAAALGACSSGGSGGGASPVLVAATFVGAGATPAAGDYLLLQTSADVELQTGAILDDTDVELSGGTLGAVSFVPMLDSPRIVRVVLGTGVSFQPGTTTITFSTENDVVRSTSGALAVPGTPKTIEAGDGDAPTITGLTIEGIDSELNGTGPAGGRLQVPRTGFDIDVDARDTSSSVDAMRTMLWSDGPVAVNGQNRAAGQDLATALTITLSGERISLAVPANVVFPPGEATITAMVTDDTGRASAPVSFTFRTIDATDSIRPLEDGQHWFLDTSRDVESYDVQTNTLQTRITEVAVVTGANGRSDVEDLMLVVGLEATAPLPGVSGGQDSNQVVFAAWQAQVLSDLDRLYDGANVDFTFAGSGAFPSGRISVPYADFSFSRICIAGSADDTGTSGTLGAALLDPHNKFHEDDCVLDFQGMRLGIFLHTAVRFGSVTGVTSTWRTIFDPFTPAIGGTPIGGDAQDGARLTGTLVDNRANQIAEAILAFARLTAVVTAHECGHSMGLVADGPMPQGLYGGDPVNFPLSRGLDPSAAEGHIQNTDLFPPGSQNVMSPAIDFDSSLSPSTAFNTLNRAYLHERALYNE